MPLISYSSRKRIDVSDSICSRSVTGDGYNLRPLPGSISFTDTITDPDAFQLDPILLSDSGSISSRYKPLALASGQGGMSEYQTLSITFPKPSARIRFSPVFERLLINQLEAAGGNYTSLVWEQVSALKLFFLQQQFS